METNTEREVLLHTACGDVRGIAREDCRAFLGVPFAHAARFCYAVPAERWDGVLDATRFGPGCPQNRAVHEHPEHPTRRFYKREFRDGLTFSYDEDCLNLNIYTPAEARGAPVIVFFYGGGFDSGLNSESPFDGAALARRGIVTVFANYRVGPLGYLTGAEVRAEAGREGNFGLDDQLTAIRWVKAHIGDFGGDGENITLMGQSAGAISTQYLCLNPANAGLFRRAAMLSGAGRFPKPFLPKRAEDTRPYWAEFARLCGCDSLAALRRVPTDTLFDAVERIKTLRRDNTVCTMPVVDGLLLPEDAGALFRSPLPIDYLIGYTNTDLYAPVMAWIGNRFARQTGAYIYFFDLDAPGDDNRAFHSADLRYVFGTLEKSWRPYGARDDAASAQMMDYLANFARCGDVNGPGLPRWDRAGRALRPGVLRIGPEGTAMGHTPYGRLLRNFLAKGEPKA